MLVSFCIILNLSSSYYIPTLFIRLYFHTTSSNLDSMFIHKTICSLPCPHPITCSTASLLVRMQLKHTAQHVPYHSRAKYPHDPKPTTKHQPNNKIVKRKWFTHTSPQHRFGIFNNITWDLSCWIGEFRQLLLASPPPESNACSSVCAWSLRGQATSTLIPVDCST